MEHVYRSDLDQGIFLQPFTLAQCQFRSKGANAGVEGGVFVIWRQRCDFALVFFQVKV